MDDKRFQQIETLGLTTEEFKEYLTIKNSRELRKKYEEEESFPLKLFYDSGCCSKHLLVDDEPVGFKLKGWIFLFDVEEYTLLDAIEQNEQVLLFGGESYKLHLPDQIHAKALQENQNKINLCIEVLNKIFHRQDKHWDGLCIWLNKRIASDYCQTYDLETGMKRSIFIARKQSTVFMLKPYVAIKSPEEE